MALRSASRIAATGLLVALAAASGALAQTSSVDVTGRRLFLRCASCHALSPDATAKIGPNLHGVVGRKAGSLPGYDYSPAMKAANFVWTEPMLDRWLTDPNAVVPGTSMAFAGLPDAGDRKAVIAYLKKGGR